MHLLWTYIFFNIKRIIFCRFGVQNQTMYTEIHPDGGLILFISKLDQSMAGEYTCTANLGGTEPLKTSVVLKTICT